MLEVRKVKKRRRQKDQQNKQIDRNKESEEEKQSRRQKVQQNMQTLRHKESKNMRRLRLQKDREHKRMVRGKFRMEGNAMKRLNMFRERVRWGPSFPCIICHQALFKHQVLEYTTELETKIKNMSSKNLIQRTLSVPPDNFHKLMEEKRALDYEHRMRYQKKNPGIPVPDQITLESTKERNSSDHIFSTVCHNSNKKGTLFICRVCSTYLKKKKCPPKSNSNSLKVYEVPDNVKLRSYLEEALIARVLLFIKIFHLNLHLCQL